MYLILLFCAVLKVHLVSICVYVYVCVLIRTLFTLLGFAYRNELKNDNDDRAKLSLTLTS